MRIAIDVRKIKDFGIGTYLRNLIRHLPALDIAQRLGPDSTVVTLMVDSGIKYLSTALYKNSSPSAKPSS